MLEISKNESKFTFTIFIIYTIHHFKSLLLNKRSLEKQNLSFTITIFNNNERTKVPSSKNIRISIFLCKNFHYNFVIRVINKITEHMNVKYITIVYSNTIVYLRNNLPTKGKILITFFPHHIKLFPSLCYQFPSRYRSSQRRVSPANSIHDAFYAIKRIKRHVDGRVSSDCEWMHIRCTCVLEYDSSRNTHISEVGHHPALQMHTGSLNACCKYVDAENSAYDMHSSQVSRRESFRFNAVMRF